MLAPAWNDFFLATAGAAAALTGLVFVGVSISLARIQQRPSIAVLALEALLLFLFILLVSLLGLVPQVSSRLFAWEVLVLALALGSTLTVLGQRIKRATPAPYRQAQRRSFAFNQLVLLLYFLAAACLLAGLPQGTHWLVLAFLLTLAKGLYDAWVLLPEIHR